VIIRSRRLAALGAVVVLVSCNGDADAPATLPDVTTSPSPTAVVTDAPGPATDVDPPVEPDDAHEYSAEGVEAFTRYAIDVINYAYQTNDVSLLQEIMTDNCQTCANVVRAIQGYVEEGGWVEGGQMIVDFIIAQEPRDDTDPTALADLTVTASRTYDGASAVVDTQDERYGQFVFFISRKGSTWMLDGMEFGTGEHSSLAPSPSS
jgi:hypothetical protein